MNIEHSSEDALKTVPQNDRKFRKANITKAVLLSQDKTYLVVLCCQVRLITQIGLLVCCSSIEVGFCPRLTREIS